MRPSILIIILFLSSASPRLCGETEPPSAQDAQHDRPNFIIIMADDLGYGDISPYGGWIETPNLDRLAREGMRFTDFHSSGVVCSPTRAGLLTGRYQQRAGISGVIYAAPQNKSHTYGLGSREITLAEVLREHGYATAIFGKWHLGYFPPYNPVRHGFNEFRGYVSGNIDFFSHIDQAGARDWWRDDELHDEPGYVTHLIDRHAVRFIEENKDGPFCLYLPHEAPHYPYQGPGDRPRRTPGNGRAADDEWSDEELKKRYEQMVREVDRSLGHILDALEVAGIDDRTLILFFSDNGASRNGSNKPLRGFKGSVWEGGHRVPCIAWSPGRIEAGEVNDQLAITLDVMPTILSIAGATPPADRALDGLDLSPVLLEGAALPDRALFWNGVAIRDGRWKLIARNGQTPLLFDLETDPGEQADRAAEHPERVAAMRAALEAWRTDVRKGATPQPSESAGGDPPDSSPLSER